jgi:hypothetical protein
MKKGLLIVFLFAAHAVEVHAGYYGGYRSSYRPSYQPTYRPTYRPSTTVFPRAPLAQPRPQPLTVKPVKLPPPQPKPQVAPPRPSRPLVGATAAPASVIRSTSFPWWMFWMWGRNSAENESEKTPHGDVRNEEKPKQKRKGCFGRQP